MTTMHPIAKNSVVDHVVERLRTFIQEGGMNAGDRLPTETVLAQQLSVSRGALREAVRRLETVGLLTVAQGRGMFVAGNRDLSSCARLFQSALTISPKDSLQFADFRRIIERYTVRRAAESATVEDVAELERLCELKRVQGATPEGVQTDWLFHRKLAQIAGNELILNVLTVLQEFVVAGIWHTARIERNSEAEKRSHQLHVAIVEAVSAHDPQRAEEAMERHMDALERSLQAVDEPQGRSAKKRGRDAGQAKPCLV